MVNPDMFDKRLLLISGKGGVGKSTVCSALALSAARMGKQVLVIELDERERIPRLFGSAKVGYEGAFVHPNIFVRNLLPASAMDDFVGAQVGMKRIAKQILGSPIYKYFVAAAPGLKEFVTLGKIVLLEQEKGNNGKPKYDIIIVDAPATGHGVAFLRVPFAAADILKVGWIRKQADDIIGLITDPAKTMLNVVTLPEEMPVNETMELCENVEELLGIPIGCIIINSVFPQILKKREAALFETMKKRARADALTKLPKAERACIAAMFECLEAAMRRRELNELYIARLKRKLKYDFMQIPFIFTPTFDIDLIQEVSGRMMDVPRKGR